MIVISHNSKQVVSVKSTVSGAIPYKRTNSISLVIKELAEKCPLELIIWHHELVSNALNLELISTLFHHEKIMMSYNPSNHNFLNDAIGFVELSLYIKVNKEVRYPTWQMSGCVGGIYSSVINNLATDIIFDVDFDYFLNSLAKLAMPLGLFCYSEPKLFKGDVQLNKENNLLFTTFKFVKQHYKIQWSFLLLLNLLIYNKRLAIIPFLRCLFYAKRKIDTSVLDQIDSNSSLKNNVLNTIDVIIPTIGREKYLYDVLHDLSIQTFLPDNIIIVEQNPEENSISKLNYLIEEDWPFEIRHTFIHQTGACNARNIALEQVQSNWVFFADDDIRFENDFLEKCCENVEKYALKVITLACLRKNDEIKIGAPMQWSGFGSGCSFVKSKVLNGLEFNMQYEFGFGEDSEFGMQLRNNGSDVVYFHSPSLLHLKAPVGGFRTKHINPWDTEKIKPKPSPTVLLFEKVNKSRAQVLGYKTVLFMKFYRRQKIKNPFLYFNMFKKQWEISQQWAEKLQRKS